MKYETYLFDLDGTLIHTLDLIVECFKHSLNIGQDIHLSDEEIKSKIGLPLLDQMKLYLGDSKDINYEKIMKKHMEYQIQHWKDFVYVYDGIFNLLKQLKNNNKIMAIVTSRKKKTAHLYLQDLRLINFFSIIVTPEDTEKHKPNPAPVLFALENLNQKHYNTLFVGDSPFDMEAGIKAQVDVAFAQWAHEVKNNSPIANYYISSPEEILKL